MNACNIGMSLIYVCHPFRGDPVGNAARVTAICRQIVKDGDCPVGPPVYLPLFVHDEETAMRCCLALLEACDEVRVYGEQITAGMRAEIDHARERSIQVRWMNPA